MFRPGAIVESNKKSALKGGAPVFMCLFTGQSPVFDGKHKALHCMELPFVFDNIDNANQMSGAWINFAKTGNSNYKNIRDWPTYNTTNTATMHFDVTCEVKSQLDKELFELVGHN